MEESPALTIWLYWHDGAHRSMPPIIEAAVESVFANSECEVRLCNQEDAFRLLPELPEEFRRLRPAHQADLFRVGVLSKFGGMYIDADTFVLKPLAGLFELLADYEYVGIDWRPQRFAPSFWLPLASTILGPARPALPFLRRTYEMQLSVLESKRHLLRAIRHDSLAGKLRARMPGPLKGARYPFEWDDLLSDIIVPNFVHLPPIAKMFGGAASWGSLIGGPGHEYGDLGHPLKSITEIGGRLPDTELMTLAYSLLPRSVRRASAQRLRRQDTALAALMQATLPLTP
jgi:hypothetical protein